MTSKPTLHPITIGPTSYVIEGNPTYLYSGEFHYFRVPKRDWRRRMRLFRDAGGNCLATYVPWLIHEPEEGRFVFGGRTGTHDLEGFLEMAAEEGLYVIARPGPYQYSELKYDGLAGWLCEGYPELHAHDLSGKIFRQSSLSYLHPAFLAKVERWFGEVCPRIARWTVSRGGPVAFAQFDNELGGIHTWFGSLDYNAQTIGIGDPEGRFPRFLQKRYGDLARLNALYGSAFKSFAEVTPQAMPREPEVADIRRARDYFHFYQAMLAEYAQVLCDLMRRHGIDTPFVHNSAAPAMNAWFKPMAETITHPFVLGTDHYYTLGQDWAQNNPTPQHAVKAFVSFELLRNMGFPPTVFELPGGSLSDWPPVTPHDAKACYLMNLALGMKGSNYYILTGGPNVPGTGTTADVYDYGAAIGPRGEVRPLYQVQKEVGLFLRKNPWLTEAEQECGFRLGFDPELPIAELYGDPARGPWTFAPKDAWTFLHRGALSTAFCAGLSPSLADLGADDWKDERATPLVVVTSAVMARAVQEKLVRFLQTGGRLLLMPVLPTHDEQFEPCTILADYLGGVNTVKHVAQFCRVTVAGVENIYMNGELFALENLPDSAEEIGRDEISGKPLAALCRPSGGGAAIVLGFRWSQAKREHEAMLTGLLKRLGFKARLTGSNPNVWATLRTAGKRSALFLMNLLSAPQETRVRYRPKWSGKMLDTGLQRLAPMSVKVVLIKGEAIAKPLAQVSNIE